MAILAKSTGEPRDLIPAGSYFGAIIGVYDIGTQGGGQFGPSHQIILEFELHRKRGVCRDKNDKVLTIAKFYNLAFSDKANLRKDLEKILGRSFTDEEAKAGYDVTELLEKTCRMAIQHAPKADGSGQRDEISGFMPMDDDDPEIEIASDSVVYELDPSEDVPDNVPKWIAKKITQAAEWVAANGANTPADTSGGHKSGKANGKPTAKVGNGKATAKTNGKAKNQNADDDDDSDVPF